MNFRNLLSDPAWQSIGVIITVFLFLIPYIFKTKNKKNIVFSIQSNTPLISVDEKVVNDIHIEYKGNKIDNVRLIICSFKNNGNIPITKNDYEQPIRVYFPFESEILSADISEKTPSSIHVLFSKIREIETSNFYIEIEPALLNQGDRFSINILAVNVEGTIRANARIVGISEVENINITNTTTTEADAIWSFRLWINLFMFFSILASVPLFIYPNLSSEFPFLIIPMSCGLIGIIFFRLSIQGLARHPKFGLQLKELIDTLFSSGRIN